MYTLLPTKRLKRVRKILSSHVYAEAFRRKEAEVDSRRRENSLFCCSRDKAWICCIGNIKQKEKLSWTINLSICPGWSLEPEMMRSALSLTALVESVLLGDLNKM